MNRESLLRKNQEHNLKSFSLVAILIFNAILFILLIKFGKPIFATNDDFRMRLIVSGRYSGTPSGQAVFLNMILGYLLAGLYSIAPHFEWYGCFFEGGMFLSVSIAEFIFLKRVKDWSNFIVRFFAIAVISLVVFQKQILMPQFTVLAAFFASAGVCCLIEVMHQIQEKANHSYLYGIAAVLFMVTSCLVRGMVALMILPVFVVLCGVILYIMWSDHAEIRYNKSQFKRILIILLATLILVPGLRIINEVNQHIGDSKDYYEFTSARSSNVDYAGFPNWKDNKELYKSLGINKKVYNALIQRNYDASYAINTKSLEALAEASESSLDLTSWRNIGGKFHSMFNIMTSSEVRYAFIATLIAIMFLFLCSGKNKVVFRFIAPMFLVYFFGVNTALILYGRLMARIIESVSILTVLATFSVFGGSSYISQKYNIKKNAIRLLSCMLIASLVIWSNQIALQTRQGTIRPNILMKTNQLQALRDYAHEHPDNFYFYNTLDFIACTEKVFDHSGEFENMESLGTWYIHSKLYNERNAKLKMHSAIHALIHNDNVYYADIGKYHSGLDGLLREANKKFVKVDVIEYKNSKIKIFKAVKIPKYYDKTVPGATANHAMFPEDY